MVVVGGIVDFAHRLGGAHEAVAADDRCGKSLGESSRHGQRALNPCEDVARRDAAVAQFFGQGVDPAQPLGSSGSVGRVDLGVDHAPAAVELLRLAEENIFAAGVIKIFESLYATEPHDLDGCRAVGKKADEAHLGPFALGCEGEEAPSDLHGRHLARERGEGVGLRAVDVVCGEMAQQVGARLDVKFLFEQLLSRRAYPFDIFYLRIVHFSARDFMMASASSMSTGVVILMFSGDPPTSTTF